MKIMKKDTAPIRILIADDHKIMREGLLSLLEKQQNMEVIAEAENGRKAVQLALAKRPDIVIMDISMPELNGIEATRQILAELSETRVIALSMHSDKRFVVEMFQAGASGFLLKDCAYQELALAINTVAAHQTYLSPEVASVMIEDYVNRFPVPTSSPSSRLTGREREVLQLVAEGWPTKKIAEHLYVSVKTVETHRRQIMKKLEIYSIADLTKYAIREGLTSI
jgi:DNA-binding NarL/FixJ family response regulator